MKRISLVTLFLSVAVTFSAMGQHRVLGEVKKKLNSLSLTADTYKGALTTLKPALSHDETKEVAETWYLQGKLQYGYYDRCMDAKSVGKKVDVKAMGHALIDGYAGFCKALSLDTIVEVDKKGNAKIDKKTGAPKFKTKYSSEITSKIASHHSDYNTSGGDLYNNKDWDGAFEAWEIFCTINDNITHAMVDTVIGQARFYQALAKWQKGDNKSAVDYFAKARSMGYCKKECYDYALVCLSAINDERGIISLAREAYSRFGSSEPQFVRVLINDNINNKEFDKAGKLLDEVIAENDLDAEIFNLKGLVVEQKDGMEKALPFYQKCIELDPENSQGHFNVGRYYYNEATMVPEKFPRLSGRKLAEKANPLYRNALPHFEKAYEHDKSNEDVKNALRNIYYKLGEGKKLQQIEN